MAKHGEHGSGNLVCSFCGKSQDEVRKLIAGPTVYICDECIDLCNDIIAEECDHVRPGPVQRYVGPVPASDAHPELNGLIVGGDGPAMEGYEPRTRDVGARGAIDMELNRVRPG